MKIDLISKCVAFLGASLGSGIEFSIADIETNCKYMRYNSDRCVINPTYRWIVVILTFPQKEKSQLYLVRKKNFYKHYCMRKIDHQSQSTMTRKKGY